MKTLILYCTHVVNDSLLYFIKRGIIENDDYHYYFIFNNPTLIPPVSLLNKKNVKTVIRENIGSDFGGWSHVLLSNSADKPMYLDYDYFILLNGSCIGPILPLYCLKSDWVETFCNNINSEVKLFGPTINNHGNIEHVQSYFMCTDKIGIKIGIDNNIIYHNNITVKNAADKWDIISNHELKYSQSIIKNGYNIGCLMLQYKNYDFRKSRYIASTFSTAHPYEIIFYKLANGTQYNHFLQLYKAKN
jgi:lipopolysaccharide biosynthesis protein